MLFERRMHAETNQDLSVQLDALRRTMRRVEGRGVEPGEPHHYHSQSQVCRHLPVHLHTLRTGHVVHPAHPRSDNLRRGDMLNPTAAWARGSQHTNATTLPHWVSE